MSEHLLKHHGFCNSETLGKEGFVMLTVMMLVAVAGLCPPRICIREGNGTPLQYSCLENPMGRGAW